MLASFFSIRDAVIFTTSKNTAAMFLAKSVEKCVCFCQFQYEVYNWQYFIRHWKKLHLLQIHSFKTKSQKHSQCVFASGKNAMYPSILCYHI